jgi:hypothetical protein
VVHFIDLFSNQPESLPAFSGQEVVLARSRPCTMATRASQPSPPFHSLQKWIERAGTDLVAMTTQFADDPLPVDRTLGRVVENMHFPKAEQDLTSEKIQFFAHITVIVNGKRNKIKKVFSRDKGSFLG